jgi:S-adenosylmethionine hydrolase
VGSPVLTVSASGLTSATTIFAITSTSLHHFTITAVPSPQTAGSAFSITVTAVDQYGNTVTGYAGQNTLSDLSGTISPTSTTSFSGGVWTGSVTITKAYQSDTISTLGSGKSGTTNSFDIQPSALDHFTISGYPSSAITGQSFNITVITWDAYGNIATSYAGQVYFTSSDGQAVLPYTSGNKYTFTSGDNGSHTFTGFQLNTAPSQTITVTDGVKSATSNLITVMLPITPPTYSNILVSSTAAGQQCTFSSQWNDNYGLSGFIFSTNNTGLWQNTTWTPFLSTPSWASVTQNLNSNSGTVIVYIWYANNTNGLWNNTGIQTITTTDSGLGVSPFSIISNSTISELAFNSTSQVLEFTVSGPPGTTGYTNITIAKTLIEDISGLTVYLDGNQIQYVNSSTQFDWLLYFTYHHSTHKVIIAMKSTAQLPQAFDLNSLLLSAAFIASVFGASMIIWRRLRIKRLMGDANRTVHSASAS